MTSEKAIPAIKTAIDKTNKFFFQIGFSFMLSFLTKHINFSKDFLIFLKIDKLAWNIMIKVNVIPNC